MHTVTKSSKLRNTHDTASQYCGKSDRWLWGQSTPRGPIPCIRLGKTVLYDWAALDKFFAELSAVDESEVAPMSNLKRLQSQLNAFTRITEDRHLSRDESDRCHEVRMEIHQIELGTRLNVKDGVRCTYIGNGTVEKPKWTHGQLGTLVSIRGNHCQVDLGKHVCGIDALDLEALHDGMSEYELTVANADESGVVA